MAEIKLKKRYKYAGDIFSKLIDIKFDVETATDFLNDIKDADVVEVVRCKDCQHRHVPMRCALWYGTCGEKEYFVEKGDEFSCSFGERRTDDDL